MKRVLVAGSTGEIGKRLVQELIQTKTIDQVILLNRRKTALSSPKIKEYIVDYTQLSRFEFDHEIDTFFCCIGTTQKKAGSKKAFQAVDLDIPVALAQLGENIPTERFIVVSSIGAHPDSKSFYLKTKGIMEREVMKTSIPQISILRPSLLLGAREEFRLTEMLSKWLSYIITPLLLGPLKQYRPISMNVVASSMVKLSQKELFEGVEIIESEQIKTI